MKLTTKILIGVILILSIASSTFFIQWQKNKDRADRMDTNFQDVVKENNQLNLTYKELNSIQKDKIDRLTDSLNIKTKKVVEYINTHTRDTIHDTISVNLTLIEPFTYKFTKDTACFHIEGFVNNKNQIPLLKFTELEHDNTVETLLYKQRKEWKFLFVKCNWFGKKEYELSTFSKCGKSTTQKINLIRK